MGMLLIILPSLSEKDSLPYSIAIICKAEADLFNLQDVISGDKTFGEIQFRFDGVAELEFTLIESFREEVEDDLDDDEEDADEVDDPDELEDDELDDFAEEDLDFLDNEGEVLSVDTLCTSATVFCFCLILGRCVLVVSDSEDI
ncbi:jg12060 [Pararge aegeria aegeria]|uniref:Jg12060 protein n=1 Tax=Pararge aegeria aegeria TaxID=348720 RepID=A0A8S4QV06_9NEOP|nr:jg12060 [Pararge aegeria aegeria]